MYANFQTYRLKLDFHNHKNYFAIQVEEQILVIGLTEHIPTRPW